MKYMAKYAIEESAKHIFNKSPKQPMNLGQELAWEPSRPSQQPTRAR
jgi:hypothetical protein